MLLDVTNQERQSITRGATTFTYYQYLDLLKSAAALYDRRKVATQRRSVNKASFSSDSVQEDLTQLCINEMRRRLPGSTMDKATWNAMSPDHQKIWDMLPDTSKKLILDSAAKRVTTESTPTITANVHEAATPSESQDTIDTLPSEETQSTPTTEINSAVTKARGDAHPGDIRRMMGSTKSKTTIKAHFACFGDSDDDSEECDESDVDDIIGDYWGDDQEDDDSDFQAGA
jgi:hypothetical protein